MDILSAVKEAIELVVLIYDKYSEYRDADETIKSTYSRLDSIEVGLELFQEYLIRAGPGLHARPKQALSRSMQKVSDLLHELNERLSPSITISRKLAWVGWGKRRVEGLLLDLKGWNEDIHRIMFALDVLGKVRDNDVLYRRLFDTGDRSLQATWSLSKRIHASDAAVPNLPVPLSSITDDPSNLSDRSLARLNSEVVYLEAHYIDRSGDETQQRRATERMAGVFASPDLPLMHLLSCLGFAENYLPFERCFLVYQLPSSAHLDEVQLDRVPTLADALERQTRIALENRFRIGVEIATAVMEIHASGWVHKSIRSDNVLVFVSEEKKGSKKDAKVGTAYLVGFEAARPLIQGSEQRPESDIAKRRYQHPERQGGRDTLVKKFDIRHDMYSLGAVLIEIGYRKTLRSIFGVSPRDTRGDPLPGEAEENHKRLLDYAFRLSDKMGSKYAKAVVACLTKSTRANATTEVLREEFYDDVLRPLRQINEGFGI
ncbi:hypothetical protein CPB85DRAFT_254194 [Mucidula mucida]|nr:hypothetical protein CPB85DRAFT_254194 [Mucidula mucida]